ncbi:DUF4118 domain-containing protein, partial [Burkholderia stabilis]
RHYVYAAAICAAITVVASVVSARLDLTNLVMLYLLGVVFSAVRLGRGPGVLQSFLSVAAFDFFFVPPRMSFSVSDTQYLLTFFGMLLTSLVISHLTSTLTRQASVAQRRERRTGAIYAMARELGAALTTEQIVEIGSRHVGEVFRARVAFLLPDSADKVRQKIEEPDAAVTLTGADLDTDVGQWVYDQQKPAGRGTDTLPATAALYLPLKAPMRVRGVLVLFGDAQPVPTDPDDRRLIDALCSSIAMALERVHYVGVAQHTLVRIEGERLRNALLSAVSHDLKTPLTAIRGLAETLERPERLANGQPAALARGIRNQAEALHGLVVNLLDLARMQSEGVRLNREWHMLDEIVGSALAHSAGVLAGRDVSADLPADLPLIDVDALLIERVLMNLLDNAAKYAGADAAVAVRARAFGETLYVFVEDDGPGFVARNTEPLFEPFERERKESSISGVGLGLALCRSIVNAHGGSIRAVPLDPHGARFEIRLPMGAPPDIEHESRT